MLPRIFEVDTRRAPWGDYGNILTHGLVHGENRGKGRAALERTGPFIPEMSLPSQALIVTAAFRVKLKKMDLKGMRFIRVEKRRIVRLAWEEWPKNAERPRRIPFGGEPEGYILQGKHNPEVSKSMGELFDLRPRQYLPIVQQGKETRYGTKYDRWLLDPRPYRGDDFIGCERGGTIYVTDKARNRLNPFVRKWIRFRRVPWAKL
jgi:hypothetical protein